MPDKPKAKTDAEKRQQESMPDSEQTNTKTDPDAGKSESDDSGGETSDRTAEQFDKLKRHNKELAEKVRHLQGEQKGNVFDIGGQPQRGEDLSKQSQQVSQDYSHLGEQEVESEIENAIDEDGLVDVQLLNKKLNEANKRASRAEMRAQQVVKNVRQMEESQQLREAYDEYPELNPRGEEFDEGFFELVRDSMVGHMARGERDLLKVADKVSSHYDFSKSQDDEEDLIEKKKKEAEKKAEQARQANATGTGSGIRQTEMSTLDEEELVRAVQHNKKGALAEMLRRHEGKQQ